MIATYICWCPEFGESEGDGWPCPTDDAGWAAEQWARRYDAMTADYSIAAGRSEPEVHVRTPEGAVVRLTVTARAEPVYTASPVKGAR